MLGEVIVMVATVLVFAFWLTSLLFATKASYRLQRERWMLGYFMAFIVVSILIGLSVLPVRWTFRYQEEIYMLLKVGFILVIWVFAFFGAQHLSNKEQQKTERQLLLKYSHVLTRYTERFGVPKGLQEQIQSIENLKAQVQDWIGQDPYWNKMG
jgi:amino acid transporter